MSRELGRRRQHHLPARRWCCRARRLLALARRRGVAIATDQPPLAYVPFRGVHQAGITHAQNAQGLLAAFTVTSRGRRELTGMLRTLSHESSG